jgi:DNA-binding beta-propeller fold protein YncE
MTRSILIALAVVASLAGAATPAGAAPGDLLAFVGDAGCIADEPFDGCRAGRGLDGAESLAVSPDGLNVYVAAASSGSVAVLRRDPVTGVLTQPAGKDACHAVEGSECRRSRETEGAYGVAVSPDGLNVYAAAFRSGAVSAFARDPATGLLKQLKGADGCTVEFDVDREEPTTCTEGRGLASVSALTVSPDGRNVYAVADRSDAVTAFARDPATGALHQLPGLDGCASQSGSGGGCAKADGLDGAESIVVSADGAFVHVAGSASGGVATFARDAGTGALRQLDGANGCIVTAAKHPRCGVAPGMGGAWGIALAPGGTSLYVGALATSSLAILARDPATGRLQPLPKPTGCLRQPPVLLGPCTAVPHLGGISNLAVAPEGDRLYGAAFTDDTLVTLARAADGTLAPIAGPAGCLTHSEVEGCEQVPGLDGASNVQLSPDGRNVYVASDIADAIVAVARQPVTVAPALAYRSGAARRGKAFVLLPRVLALRPARFAVTPRLPAGLVLNTETGSISGRPTGTAPARTYTVTLTTDGGTVAATLRLQVRR